MTEEKSSINREFPNLGIGLGLRPTHYTRVLEGDVHPAKWFEVITENFLGLEDGGPGGRPLAILEKVRASYPIVLHGVSLSIGSVDPINKKYLQKLKQLAKNVEPAWISDHLCWTGVDGKNLHDLMPLPFTEEAITHIVNRILEVQDFLDRRIVLENVSSYVTFETSEMQEWEFISEVSKRADCFLLLDVNNVYVNSVNHGFNPKTYLEGIPTDRVVQFHLAGHSREEDLLIDTHDSPVCDEVWELFDAAVNRFGALSTLVEWDDKIPQFDVLLDQARIAHSKLERRYAKG